MIIRARRYYKEVAGANAAIQNVLEGPATKETFENRFKEEHIYEGNPSVQKWLRQMTADKKG